MYIVHRMAHTECSFNIHNKFFFRDIYCGGALGVFINCIFIFHWLHITSTCILLQCLVERRIFYSHLYRNNIPICVLILMKKHCLGCEVLRINFIYHKCHSAKSRIFKIFKIENKENEYIQAKAYTPTLSSISPTQHFFYDSWKGNSAYQFKPNNFFSIIRPFKVKVSLTNCYESTFDMPMLPSPSSPSSSL